MISLPVYCVPGYVSLLPVKCLGPAEVRASPVCQEASQAARIWQTGLLL